MKLLHIAPIGHHAEGIGSVLKELVPMQINCGADVRIISIYENRIYAELPIASIKDVKQFKKYIDSWRPDFVLFHSVYAISYVLFYRELIKRNISYGIQMHGGLSEENFRRKRIKKIVANQLLFNRFFKKAQKIIYLSESEYHRCIVKRINPQMTIIPNGCNDHLIDDKLLPIDRIEIIYVGRISFYVKGLDKLVEAIDMLEGRDDVHFSIYGNEDDIHTGIFKEIIKGKEKIVEYRGGLYDAEKEIIMRKANIFILTSPSEGMPMGVLEALSYGIPCIVTPGTNMASIITQYNAGWVSKYDSNEIRKTIIQALTEYRKDQISYRSGAYMASKDYNWENIARLSIQILSDISKKNEDRYSNNE